MKTQLKNVATIQMGYSFRSRLEPVHGGNVAVIQMRNLLHDNTVDCENLVTIDMEVIKEHLLARKGDLIFRSRGNVPTAAIIADDPGRAIIAAPLLRIRVKEPRMVLPAYLNWYISQRDAQSFLLSREIGSVHKMVNKQSIEELEVLMPDINKQRAITELATLSAREHTLLHALAEKQKQCVSTMLMQFAKREATV